MKQSFICFIAAGLLVNPLFARDKIGVYIQAGPYLNLNNYKYTGTGSTHMATAQLSYGAGVEVEIPVKRNLSLVPFVKWHNQRLQVEQTESNGMFTPDSYFQVFHGYGTINVGAFAQYSMFKKNNTDWQLLAGLSYAHSSSNLNGVRYKYESNMDGSYSIIVGSDRKEDDFSSKADMMNISLGSRVATHIRKVGDFKFGLIFYAPTGRMPEVNYISEFASGSGQNLYTHTQTRTRQYSIEISILYRLFGWRA